MPLPLQQTDGLIMVAVRPKPRTSESLSKFKPAKQVGKKVLSGYLRANVCGDKEESFTEEWYASRRKMKEVLEFYRDLLEKKKLLDQLSQKQGMSPDKRQYSGLRVHMKVARVLKSLGKWINTSKQIGHVPGIKVGDMFFWRCELRVVGLHHEFQRGIDCMKLISGKTLATSIVDSGRYENVVGITSDELIYCGEGENPDVGLGKKPKDQKIVGRNLALKNNMIEKIPVRVIRRINNNGNCYKFVYCGLYHVTGFWKERGKFGKHVYKFSLKKVERQPELNMGRLNKPGSGSAGSVSQGRKKD